MGVCFPCTPQVKRNIRVDEKSINPLLATFICQKANYTKKGKQKAPY
jgi:hypothetical protein